MGKQERILVPLRPDSKDLSALYHALSLAGRIKAKVFILYFKSVNRESDLGAWWEEALEDVIKGACQEGLSVSYHVAEGPFEKEVVDLIREEEINLLVFGADEENILMEQSLRRIRSKVSTPIIKVREKDIFSYL